MERAAGTGGAAGGLAGRLGNRRWVFGQRPFPHVVARDVFTPDAYADLAETVPPLDNSLLMFECAPTSHHAFLGGRTEETLARRRNVVNVSSLSGLRIFPQSGPRR